MKRAGCTIADIYIAPPGYWVFNLIAAAVIKRN